MSIHLFEGAIRAVCPHVHDIMIGAEADRWDVVVVFEPEASKDQRAAVAHVISTFQTNRGLPFNPKVAFDDDNVCNPVFDGDSFAPN